MPAISKKAKAVEFEQLVMSRKSVPGYKKDAIPKEIINVAKRAPSSMNTQPWHVHVLTGDALDEVRSKNMKIMSEGGKPQRDIPSHGEYGGGSPLSPGCRCKEALCCFGDRARGQSYAPRLGDAWLQTVRRRS